MANYKISQAGQVTGELDETAIRSRLEDGRLSLDDHGWKPGMTEWKTLRELGFGMPPPPGAPSQIPQQRRNSPPVRPNSYSLWLLAAFIAPYFFSWRIIFDKNLGYSKGLKIFYVIWVTFFTGIMVSNFVLDDGTTYYRDNFKDPLAHLKPEQRKAVEELQTGLREMILRSFNEKDADKDGKLTKAEYLSENGFKTREDEFVKKDYNKDGFISWDEFRQ